MLKDKEKRAKSKEVPTGYAQNFLIKKTWQKKLQIKQLAYFVAKKKSKEKAHAEMMAEAESIKAKLAEETTLVTFVEKVGPDGRTFGSITSKKIAEELDKQFGIMIDKRHIQLDHLFVRLV